MRITILSLEDPQRMWTPPPPPPSIVLMGEINDKKPTCIMTDLKKITLRGDSHSFWFISLFWLPVWCREDRFFRVKMEPLQSYGSSKKSIFLRFITALRVESEYTQNTGSLDYNQIPMGASAGTHLVLGSGQGILCPPPTQDACSGLLSAGEVKWHGWVT